jgi:peroxiredoxin
VSSLPKPDTSRSVKLGKAMIDGDEATLALKIRIGGKDQDAKMHMRREGDDWKIRAVSATPPEGAEQTVDFEAAGTGGIAGEPSGEFDAEGRGEVPGQPMTDAPMTDPALTVPDGDAQAVLTFIENLRNDPRIKQDATFLQQALSLMLAASDKVLTQEDATKTQLTAAARYKMDALQTMIGSDVPNLNEQIEAFAKQVEELKLEELARPVKSLALLADMGTARSPAAVNAALKKVNQFLTEGEVGVSEASLARSAAQLAEYSDMKPREVSEALEELAAPLIASKNEQVAAIGNQLAGKARRFGLVGNPMELRGLTWDGKPLDMAQFEGKVVLVDFWATWCGPCIAEMPNIRKNYDKYHEQGFDVIAISIDDDQKALRDYVEKEQVPWTVVADRHEDASRSDSMSAYYGVNSIPSTILIGRDGKVVTLSARGPQLDEHLAKLIRSGGK